MPQEVTVLLVDDERLVLRSLEKTLFRAGFEVETARDARAGLALFEAHQADGPFDVAILDLHMPNLEGESDPDAGLELLSELLSLEPDLPVIVLTAFDDVGRAKEAVTRGAAAYFVKGREAELINIVKDVISQ